MCLSLCVCVFDCEREKQGIESANPSSFSPPFHTLAPSVSLFFFFLLPLPFDSPSLSPCVRRYIKTSVLALCFDRSLLSPSLSLPSLRMPRHTCQRASLPQEARAGKVSQHSSSGNLVIVIIITIIINITIVRKITVSSSSSNASAGKAVAEESSARTLSLPHSLSRCLKGPAICFARRHTSVSLSFSLSLSCVCVCTLLGCFISLPLPSLLSRCCLSLSLSLCFMPAALMLHCLHLRQQLAPAIPCAKAD